MEHLIPAGWFVGVPDILLFGIVVATLAVLGKGADILVDGSVGVAYRFGMPKVVVGATIVSLGTTSPECAVSVMAAWRGDAGLALGNAVGSIIADTGLIFGLGCVLTTLSADRFLLSRQGWIQFGSALLLAILCYGAWILHGDRANLGRWIGIVFLSLLVAYMIVSVRWSRRHPRGLPAGESRNSGLASARALSLAGRILVGLGLVVFSSHVLILGVRELALRWGVSEVVIAGSIVALGTSLPELVIGMTSLRKGHKELLVGNVIGADILNVLFVIGASAFAARLPIVDEKAHVPEVFLVLHLPAMLLILVIFRLQIWAAVRRGRFRRWYGIPLLLIYGGFLIAPYLLFRG